jgi:CRP-like cAMP-binding protein
LEGPLAGKPKFLKENEIVFKAGDPADSMYIVRKGALKVFFNKGTDEVVLAQLRDGSIFGEMAFFDNKPRSASVKATEASEVTQISKADFDTLLGQVPKWMVAMMQSLVSRLRQTNERLKELEAQVAGSTGSALILPHQKYPFQHVTRSLRILLIVASREGTKEGTGFSFPLQSCLDMWREFTGEEKELFEKILDCVEKVKLISKKQDLRKVTTITLLSKGSLTHFADFYSSFSQKLKPTDGFLSPDAVSLLTALVDDVGNSGYESSSLSLNTFKAAPQSKDLGISNWVAAADELSALVDLIKVTKQQSDWVFKINLKEHRTVATYLRYIQMFKNAKLM